MPKSRVRKKKVYTPPTEARPAAMAKARKNRPSPRWVPIAALALIVVGIGWLVTYYMTQGNYPIQAWSYWNLAAGFGLLVVSLGVLTQWR